MLQEKDPEEKGENTGEERGCMTEQHPEEKGEMGEGELALTAPPALQKTSMQICT